jgi:hypothetical protein
VSPKISLQEKEIYSLDGAHKWEQLLQFVLKPLLLTVEKYCCDTYKKDCTSRLKPSEAASHPMSSAN